MSRTRRNFNAKFKSDLVLELLKGEKDLNTLASENSIQPNLLRNWKKEFLDKASVVFDDSREDNLKDKLAAERKEKASYARKVGQLTMQVDWLKKNLKKCLDLTTRVNLLRSLLTTKSNTCRDRHIELPSIHDAAHLLGINRTSVYYAHKVYEPSEDELACKRIIDHVHTDNPAWGARQLATQLQRAGYLVGRRKTARYMREMGIDAIYPRMNLSKRQQHAQVMPYLLKNVVITRPNQAWSVDITYIPIKHGFLYLTAIIDWYSRCIVGWEVDDTLDTRMVVAALNKAFKIAQPDIINSDQGCQFTSREYKSFLREKHIRQSMDGKSRWADNVMIERWFRTFKYEEAYLTQYSNIREARHAIRKYIKVYNYQRCHSAIGNVPPAEVYYPAMLLDAAKAAA